MKFFLPLTILMTFSAGALQGQEPPKGYIRFIALGDDPPVVLKEINGVRVEQDAPEGSQPPRVLSVLGSGEPPKSPRLKLRNITGYMEVANRNQTVKLYKGEEAKGAEWANLGKPLVPSTAVLIRDPEDGWKKSKSVLLKDDLRSFPLHTARLVNASNQTIAVRIGEDNTKPAFQMKPGEVKIVGASDGFKVGDVPVHFAHKVRRSWKTIYKTTINVYEKNRVHAYFYSGDRQDMVGKIGFSVLPVVYRNPDPESRGR